MMAIGCHGKNTGQQTVTKALVAKPIDENRSALITGFEVFFKRFNTDSVFQIDHVDFPLRAKIVDEEIDTTIYIPKSKWQYVSLLNNKTDIVKKVKVSESEITIIHMVEDTGLHVSYHFTRKNDDWLLVSVVDESD